MKYFIFAFLLILLPFQLALSQEIENSENPILSVKGYTYKDILDSLISKDKTYAQKMEVVRSIESIFPADKTLDLYSKMTQLAQDSNMINDFVELKSSQAFIYILTNIPDSAKAILQSANNYLDKVTNPSSLGVYYLIEGKYYALILDEAKMIDSYYKSIEHFEQGEGRRITMLTLLYGIAGYYYQYKDLVSLEKIKNKMLQLADEINESTSYIQTYSIAGAYHERVWAKDSIDVSRDSIIYYNKLIIETYTKADTPSQRSTNSMMVQAYLNLAEFMLVELEADPNSVYKWSDIEYYIDEAYNSKHDRDISSLFRYHYLKGEILLHKKKFNEAIKHGKKSLEIISKEDNHVLNKMSFYRIYNLLSKSEEKRGNYKDALKYYKLGSVIHHETQDEKRYEVGKELETKYETSKKELEISRLNEEKQKAKYQTTLIVSIAVVLIILFLVGLLYNRIKRLKKEKEASLLSARIEQKEMEYKTLQSETEQRMLRRYLDGKETERKSLAKELHDSVANEIVSIMMLNQTGADPNKIDSLLQETYNHIRQVSHQLMPPEFKYISLIGMVEDYIQLLNTTTPPHFQLIISDPDIPFIIEDIPENLAKEIYYILQEAIGNILKHANAKTATIQLSHNESKQLIVSIIDDGEGFNVDVASKGIGLRTMKERASDIKANISINTEKGKGTNIILILPINPKLHHPV